MPIDPQAVAPPRAEQARVWRRYLRFFGPKGVADLDDELQFHVDMHVRDLVARGMSEADARAATAKRLGDLAAIRRACVAITNRRQRRMNRAQIFDALVQDVRFAGRTLGRQKGWTVVAILTLALGIGASSAMFSVVNHLLLNPIAYPDASRIVLVFHQPAQGNTTGMNVMMTPSGRVVSAWRTGARSLDAIEPYTMTDATMERSGQAPSIVHTASILPSFTKFAGQRPIIGRSFSAAEARGEASVALLSEGAWRSQFGSDNNLIGKALRIDGRPLTIVGVMPATFQLPRTIVGEVDLWLPLDLERADKDGLLTVARLRPGVSPEAAARELDDIYQRVATQDKSIVRFTTRAVPPSSMLDYKSSLVLLMVAVALVLLIACANVAHLLLARASWREREMAIRAALGAGTGRLFRQLLTESLLLSVAGSIAGLAIGWVGLHVLVSVRPEGLSDLAAARMDGMTLAVTLALSVLTGLAFGLIGAVQASRHSTHESLKSGSPGTSAGRSHGRARSLLVVTEMALCTTLLVAAALLLRSIIHLRTVDPGFDTRGLYAVEIPVANRFKTPAAKGAFFRELSERTRALPGVQGWTVAAAAPPGSAFLIGALQLEGEPNPPAGVNAFLNYNAIQSDYFKIMGMRLVEGTTITDTSIAAGQVVVNEGFVKKHWPGQSGLGHRLRIVFDGQEPWRTIVGVAADAHTRGVTVSSSEPMLYVPGGAYFSSTLIVRTTGDARFVPTLARIVAGIDQRLPLAQVTAVEDAMNTSIARPRFTMFVLMVFTLVAVGLAAVGLYGVLAYTVAQRTREIGIRMALGASRGDVARLVIVKGLVLAAIGGVLGLVAARLGVRLIGKMLYGVEQTDLIAFSGGAAFLVAIAVLACLVPTRRALAIDPTIAMRAD